MVGAAVGYGAATIHQRPFEVAAAAEPRIPAAPPPASAITPAQLPQATQPIPVVTPRTQSVSSYVEVTGNAASVNAVKLIARVEGYLDKIHYEDGQFVKKDDLLFTIQQDQYKDQLQQAQAQLLTAQASLTYAKTELVRYTKLVKQDAATQTEVDHWTFERASAEASLLNAQAQLALAKLNLSYTEVRAPFDGIAGKHLIDPGNVVGGAGQQPALAEITQLDPIYVVANLSEQDVLKVRQNLNQHRLTFADLRKVPVDVALSDQSGFPLQGTIEYVSPGIDPATGTLLVRGILANPDRTLLPGFFVKMRLPMGKVDRSALLVPDRSLQEDQGGRYLLVVNKDNVVEQRYVQLGQLDGSLRVITSGLKADDRVVVGDLWRATPGTKVTPQLTSLEALSKGANQ
ncbi:MAG: efflux RND transporter periplasmic adaptor subunit [Alphaproteobacteria bacterium]|nr:efflux RND transporter periplasmic adaptor subunit [Alphaproteobacteria bacterium]